MKHKYELTNRQQKILSVIVFAVFILVTVLLLWLVGRPLVQYASEPERFRALVDSHGVTGRLAYMGMVLVQVLVALIPGEPLEILGGYAFGAVEGTILCLLSATLGSVVVFFLVRRFGIRLVRVLFPQEKLDKLRFLHSSPRRDVLFLIIFMIPGTPKDLLSYFAGLTDIRFPVWLLICSLGRLPSVVTSTVGGSALGTEHYWQAGIVFAATLAVSLLGLWIYQRICRRQDARSAAQTAESVHTGTEEQSEEEPHA